VVLEGQRLVVCWGDPSTIVSNFDQGGAVVSEADLRLGTGGIRYEQQHVMREQAAVVIMQCLLCKATRLKFRVY
jgi:hypothetical protein